MFSMRLEGGAKMAATLRNLSPSRQRGVLHKMLKTAAEPMRERMGQGAPHDPVKGTPDLKDSMVVSVVQKVPDGEGMMARRDDAQAAVAVGPSKAAPHGFLQEYGTIFHPAQPFARAGFHFGAPIAIGILSGLFWGFIRANSERSVSGRNL